MAKIDYKNRAILIAGGLSSDGTSGVDVYWDLYDNVSYIITPSGQFQLLNGQAYTPSQLPNDNKLISCYQRWGEEIGLGASWYAVMIFQNNIKRNLTFENFRITRSEFTNFEIGYLTYSEETSELIPTASNTNIIAVPVSIDPEQGQTGIVITATVTNVIEDVNTFSSVIATRYNYRLFESQEALCSYYGDAPDTNLTGTVYYEPLTGYFYADMNARSRYETDGIHLFYALDPYATDSWLTGTIANGTIGGFSSANDYCNSTPQPASFNAYWQDAPFASQEEVCLAYGIIMQNFTYEQFLGELNFGLYYNQADGKDYTEPEFINLAPAGWYLFADANLGESIYVVQVGEDGTDLTFDQAASICA